MGRRIAVLDAPSILGLQPTGVEELPNALRREGLVSRLHAEDAGRVDAPLYSKVRDALTQMLNPTGVIHYAYDLANTLTPVLRAGRFPVVLGGDCSILLGCLHALRSECTPGLVYFDGHADFYQPDESPTGEIADMVLGIATGYEALLSDAQNNPLVEPENAVLFGYRDAEETRRERSRDVTQSDILSIDLPSIRAQGIAHAVAEAKSKVYATEGYWIHLDVDVLHHELMPAVDYVLDDGLTYAELIPVLKSLLRSSRARGMDITIYNPRKDPTGEIGRKFTECIVQALT
ncbi:arginase family protein [Candidatus Pacearchaeota archaeon]|nr:arginase family protein [Candidatus Pacearchaeota archaeon]